MVVHKNATRTPHKNINQRLAWFNSLKFFDENHTVPHIGHYKDTQSKLIRGILTFADKPLGDTRDFLQGLVM